MPLTAAKNPAEAAKSPEPPLKALLNALHKKARGAKMKPPPKPLSTTALHKPLLVKEALSVFEKSGGRIFLDGTFGRGGHSLALLKAFPKAQVLALDVDHEAVEHGIQKLRPLFPKRFFMLREDFRVFALENPAGKAPDENRLPKKELPPENPASLTAAASAFRSNLDGVILDLGPSSDQLQTVRRGFSFYQKGPLDMRMDQRQEQTAAHIVNSLPLEDLTRLFQQCGKTARARGGAAAAVAKDIVRLRQKKPIQTTGELSKIILKHHFWRRGRAHPATPYFLALRMAVNQELSGLREALTALAQKLSKGGALAVISFHSLEDRIVKQTFKALQKEGEGVLWSKKLVRPSLEEIQENRSARSAGLRAFVRKHAPAAKAPRRRAAAQRSPEPQRRAAAADAKTAP